MKIKLQHVLGMLCSFMIASAVFIYVPGNEVYCTHREYSFTNESSRTVTISTLPVINVPHGEAYSSLSDIEKKVYDTLYTVGQEQCWTLTTDDTVKYYNYGYDAEEFTRNFGNACFALRQDHPSMIQFEQLDVAWHQCNFIDKYPDGSLGFEISPTEVQRINEFKSKCQSIMSSLNSQINTSTPDSTAISVYNIYKYVAKNIPYDYDCDINGNFGQDQSAYGALVKGTGVCVGLTNGYRALLELAGIPQYIVGGTLDGNGHAWNLVKIGNDWYEQDVTGGWTVRVLNAETGECKMAVTEELFSATTAQFAAGFSTTDIGTVLQHIRTGASTVWVPTATGTTYTCQYVESLIGPQEDEGGTSQEQTQEEEYEWLPTPEPAQPDPGADSQQEQGGDTSGQGTSSETSGTTGSTDIQDTAPAEGAGQGNTPAADGATTPAQAPDKQPAQTAEDTSVAPSEAANTEVIDASVKAPKSMTAAAGKGTVTVKWKKQTKKTSGYEIQYSTDKKFRKNVKKVTAKKTATSKKIKKLKSKKTYYIRIRTKYKKGGRFVYSGWSKVKKVKVK